MNRNASTLTTEGTGQPWPLNSIGRMTLPDDPTERVKLTAAAMCAMIHHAAAVGDAVRNLASMLMDDRVDQTPLRNLWRWLKEAQYRTDDPPGVELLRHPELSAFDALNTGNFEGDCDDVALLAAALAIRMGCKAVDLVVIAREGREWEHVYVRVGHATPTWAIDPQETDVPLSERPHAAELTFPVWRS